VFDPNAGGAEVAAAGVPKANPKARMIMKNQLDIFFRSSLLS
jgi:hypothetical protein